jgi:hypothetical protein
MLGCRKAWFLFYSLRPYTLNFSHTTLFDYEDLLATRPDVVFPPHVLDSIGFLDNIESPRFIKTHFPWPLLPTQIEEHKPKVIICTLWVSKRNYIKNIIFKYRWFTLREMRRTRAFPTTTTLACSKVTEELLTSSVNFFWETCVRIFLFD